MIQYIVFTNTHLVLESTNKFKEKLFYLCVCIFFAADMNYANSVENLRLLFLKDILF